MNLNEFVETLHKDAQEFHERWRRGQEKSPDEYPEDLSEGDWFEQYMAHVTMGKGLEE